MKLSIHALDQLNDRYQKWGLNIPEAISVIESIVFDSIETYRMIIIDDIPLVLICDLNEIITIYPHPLDAAEDYFSLTDKVKNQRTSVKSLKNALGSANNCINEKQRYIKKIEKQNKHLKQKMKGMWK